MFLMNRRNRYNVCIPFKPFLGKGFFKKNQLKSLTTKIQQRIISIVCAEDMLWVFIFIFVTGEAITFNTVLFCLYHFSFDGCMHFFSLVFFFFPSSFLCYCIDIVFFNAFVILKWFGYLFLLFKLINVLFLVQCSKLMILEYCDLKHYLSHGSGWFPKWCLRVPYPSSESTISIQHHDILDIYYCAFVIHLIFLYLVLCFLVYM